MTKRNADTEWTSCPSGTLRTISVQATEETGVPSRRGFLTGVAAGAVIGGLGLGAVAWRQNDKSPGNLTCAQCIEMFQAFSRGELAAGPAYRVESHLAKCDHCRSRYEEQHA